MKAKELRDLIDFISQTGLEEVNIETEEFKIRVKKSNEATKTIHDVTPAPIQMAPTPAVTTPAPAVTPAASNGNGAEAKSATSDDSNLLTIKSPMIGTFYRSSNPETDPFINIGDSISAGQTVCIVEAMKLFNEIESEVSGTIVKVLVENAQPVEYDQPLFLVDPA